MHDMFDRLHDIDPPAASSHHLAAVAIRARQLRHRRWASAAAIAVAVFALGFGTLLARADDESVTVAPSDSTEAPPQTSTTRPATSTTESRAPTTNQPRAATATPPPPDTAPPPPPDTASSPRDTASSPPDTAPPPSDTLAAAPPVAAATEPPDTTTTAPPVTTVTTPPTTTGVRPTDPRLVGDAQDPRDDRQTTTTGPAIESARTVTAGKGSSAEGQPGCTAASCRFVSTDVEGFEPDTTYDTTCATEENGQWASGGSITTDDSGAFSGELTCYYGFRGDHVYVIVEGTRSPSITW